MSDETQTPAEESNDQATPDAAESSAEDLSVDQLLEEFDQQQTNTETNESEQSKQPTPDSAQQDTAQLNPEDRARLQAVENELYERAISDAVDITRGDSNIPEKAVRALLEQDAARDPRFMRAWVNRGKNPVAYEKILKAKGREYADLFANQVDQQATEQREEIVAAVQGTKTKGAPTTQQQQRDFENKVSKMSDEDLYAMMYHGRAG